MLSKITVKAVLMDIDGTITETKSFISHDVSLYGNDFFNIILRDILVKRDGLRPEEALQKIRDAERLCVRGDPFFAAIVLGLSSDELWRRCCEWAEKGGLFVYSDAVSMIKTLHKRRFRLVTITNNGAIGVFVKLLRAGLANREGKTYFSVFYGDDSLGDSKSNPEVYARLLKREGWKGNEVVMIGDSVVDDLENAKKGGVVHCIIVDRNQKEDVSLRNGGIFVNSLIHVSDLLESG